jgi:hypothetical protein
MGVNSDSPGSPLVEPALTGLAEEGLEGIHGFQVGGVDTENGNPLFTGNSRVSLTLGAVVNRRASTIVGSWWMRCAYPPYGLRNIRYEDY